MLKKTVVVLSFALAGMILSSGAVIFAAAAADITVEVLVSPQTILLGSDQGEMVTVHAEIPYSAVNDTAQMTLTLNGIPVQFTKSDARGELVAKFLEDEVKAIFGDDAPPLVTMTLSGMTEAGESYSGSDIVKIKYRR